MLQFKKFMNTFITANAIHYHNNKRQKMFDKYIKSLSEKELNEFLDITKMSKETLRNAYLPKDPLSRRVPQVDRMVKIIVASKGQISALVLFDYFYMSVITELLRLEDDPKIHSRAKLSILDLK